MYIKIVEDKIFDDKRYRKIGLVGAKDRVVENAECI